ncbi:hypothetical protein AX15_005959 [Amanita polypyramis BW_CC]|nr:hypothetical protein AX15_005959 [Amanita polypyramis BW_CC]
MVQSGRNHPKTAPATRPPNAFMLFRSDFWAREKLKVEPVERDHRDISRIAAICWNNLDEETKGVYRKRADEHKELHRLQHPEYRYSPLPRQTTRVKRRRTGKGGSADEERCKQLAVRIMTEFHKGDVLRWPRSNTRRTLKNAKQRDPKLVLNSLESRKELKKSALNMETSTEGMVVPVTAQEDNPTLMSLKEEVIDVYQTEIGG